MEEILNTIKFGKISNRSLSNELDIISPIFVEIEDCVLLKNNNQEVNGLNMNSIYKLYGDKTGFEASHNHVHISQYMKNSERSPINDFKLALLVLDSWKSKLKVDFPNYNFHLILSFDGEESILRFHKYRTNEGSWARTDDLNGYKEEAVMVEEI